MSEHSKALQPDPAVRAGGANDVGAAAATLARAFHDDPLICALLPPGDAERPRRMQRLFELLYGLALPYGACDVTGRHEAVAIWRPPGRWRTAFWRYALHGLDYIQVFGAGGLPKALRIMHEIEAVHPSEPHYYLQAVGTEPTLQGAGFGTIVLGPQLAEADAARLPAYLESSKEQNIRFYESLGFKQMGEFTPSGGPRLWPMWRRPGGRI